MAEVPLIKLIGVANLQSPVTAEIFRPKSHRDTRLGCALTNAITFAAIKRQRVNLYHVTKCSRALLFV